MALIGFPDQISVTLGSGFVAEGGGEGNGLYSGQQLVITRDGATEYWYEKEGSNVADRNDNRLKVKWLNEGCYPIGCRTASDQWYTSTGVGLGDAFFAKFNYGGSPYDYTFLNFYNLAKNSIAVGKLIWIVEGFTGTPVANKGGPSSWASSFYAFGTGTAFGGTLSTIVSAWQNFFKLFTTMEEYVPALGPDKTTYRYG
jgi:hypothetical protein